MNSSQNFTPVSLLLCMLCNKNDYLRKITTGQHSQQCVHVMRMAANLNNYPKFTD